ncbi:MAG TPA: SCO family protein [Vicinamibacterales bacterium]|nr:SCO family protein [Vicinamibacterales bacterium]
MSYLMNGRSVVLASAMALVSAVVSAQGEGGYRPQLGVPSNQMPGELQNVEFAQRLDHQLPLDLTFVDEDGQQVRLGQYFSRKPVVVVFVYYECPMLCSQVLNGVTSALVPLNETAGRDFELVAVSFDPRDTPIAAAAKKKSYVDRYQRAGAERGFHFLTGSEASVKALTEAAGFKYAWDEQTQQFAHASGFVVATPQGRLSRYFFGIEYAPRDLRFALIESSAGRIGSIVDQVLLYCYHYDPKSGSYSFVAMKAIQLGGALTLLALIGFVAVALAREQRTAH